MRIKWGQDLVTGLLFIAIGIGAIIIGWDYPRGTPQRPGTGVLPAMLSWGLIGIGAILGFKSITAGDLPIAAWSWRPFLAVTAGTVAFGLLVDDYGLVVSMIVAMSICALGTLETKWREFSIFTLIMIVSCWATFIWLLGMPISTWPLWPLRFPSFLTGIWR